MTYDFTHSAFKVLRALELGMRPDEALELLIKFAEAAYSEGKLAGMKELKAVYDAPARR